MKQIPFTLEAFGPDGLLKDGYEVKSNDNIDIHFMRKYPEFLLVVFETGNAYDFSLKNLEKAFTMYRRARTAEEVAMEYFSKNTNAIWGQNNGGPFPKDFYIGFVQAGMDEMS